MRNACSNLMASFRSSLHADCWTVLALGCFVSVFAGCDSVDSLLKVEVPGAITEEALDDPALAVSLAAGAQGHFDCWFQPAALRNALWTTDVVYVFTSAGWIQTYLRVDWPSNTWDNGDGSSCEHFYRAFQVARANAERATQLIESFPAEEVSGSKDFLVAKTQAYAGYFYQIAGEWMCEMAYDGGPIVPREESWRIAEQRFTAAIERASLVDSDEARSILNMARVGRARARLHLEDDAGVVADASLVPAGYERMVTASAIEAFRNNYLFLRLNFEKAAAVYSRWHNMTIAADGRLTVNEGVPDPRVPLEHYGLGTGFDGVTDMWGQLKYTSLDASVPLATYREAQLMIAEVEGGETAVRIINDLRATVGDLPWVSGSPVLPDFSSTDPDEIREAVREERRRELFLQGGTRLGDKLRWGEPFVTGTNALGQQYAQDKTCIPLHPIERDTNPNIS